MVVVHGHNQNQVNRGKYKMPIKCPKGTSTIYRYKKGTSMRLGGCAKKGKFIDDGVKEVVNMALRNVKKK